VPGPVVFATRAYAPLAAELCRLGGYAAGEIERQFFPDGERYQRIITRCHGLDVVVVGGTISDSDTLELYDLASGLFHCGAARLTLIIPYFGYSTMERAGREGEVVTAKSRARLLSSIPVAGLGNRVFLLDLHVDSVAHYFEGAVHPIHVDGAPFIRAAVTAFGAGDAEETVDIAANANASANTNVKTDGSFVLGCTDAGRAKRVEHLAHQLGVPAAFVYKRRLSGSRTEVSGVSAHVRGARVVIYDDMIRTGGSLLAAAAAYRDAGATSIAAVTTHGLFVGDSLERLTSSGLFSGLAATDSHPRAIELGRDHPLLIIHSVAPLLVERLGEGP
jgi:ribose-phosphate pyrophosphokinase